MKSKMKKLLFYIIVPICIICSKSQYAARRKSFVDVDNHWAREEINACVENDIIAGYGDSTFRPNNNVTVAEFIKMVVKSVDYQLVRSGENVWPDFYIETAKYNMLVLDDEFDNYDLPITRSQAVNMLSRIIDLSDVKESKNKFKDIEQENKKVILKLNKLGIINGYEDNTFRGEKNITRAEAIVIINRAIASRKEIISGKKYDITSQTNLSNYNTNELGMYEFAYEIDDNKILIFDNGRFSNLNAYEINDSIIDVKKVIKILKKIINEDAYVTVKYVPSEHMINQLIISYGKNKEELEKGNSIFSITYYEDKNYELSRISKNNSFSNKCYMKIEVTKLWDNYSEYLSGNYFDIYNVRALENALKTEFGTTSGNKILDYILEKNKLFVSNEKNDVEHTETKKIGEYTIDFYQKENCIPQFYISKSSL